jgi:hypothetical protein
MNITAEDLAKRLVAIVDQKLEIACRIAGITQEDTKSGKKHINVFDQPGMKTYIYAEKQIPLVVITFTDDTVKVRRIRRVRFWYLLVKWHIKNLK